MNQITHLLSETLVSALGWTLLHSLWQGALTALVLGVLLILLNHHTARARYTVSGIAMLLQLLFSLVTFVHYYTSSGGTASQMLNSATEHAVPTENTATLRAYSLHEAMGTAQYYFEQHLPLLVTLWLLGLLAMILRFLGGVALTQRLRNYKTSPLALNWQHMLSDLSHRIGVKQSVKLVESALVQVPMVIGYVKPVILLPMGTVTGLTQAQVEAILAHELAHILRKDYLLNMLQSVVDILFFYHPAMWWISGMVRTERENCCDDLAVAYCGNPLVYARALAELEAMRLPTAPAMAVAFSGKKGSLINRIKRLVGQQSLRPTFSEGFMAAVVLMGGLLLFSFGAVAGLNPDTTETETDSVAERKPIESLNDATNAFVYTIQDTAGQEQDVVIIKNKKGAVTELYVDGKRIPKKDISSYNDLLNQRLSAIEQAPKASKEEVQAAMEVLRASAAKAKDTEAYRYNFNFTYDSDSTDFNFKVPPPPPAPPMPPITPAPPAPPMPPVAPLSDEKEHENYKKEVKEYKKEQEQYKNELKQYEKAMEEYAEELRQLGYQAAVRQRNAINIRAGQNTEIAHAAASTLREKAMQQHEEAIQLRQESMANHSESMRRHEKSVATMQAIRKELVKDGLLEAKTKEFELKIDAAGMTVNGQKQPQEIYEKYSKMMDLEGRKSLHYTVKNKSTSLKLE
ncbi:M56 family metallopeptidase [Pontibacter silvestris]|uniref:M56 family metallopeptidase n=1 Tax=Pontibacter silvestris TaxID=2305183 RepID=A0ABW4X248_9BACT|nr:M56 family metallopeptidase [Pontibacter silvestris]MCC9135808.1 M56 family metallopeptidase [Pontibacter silvestris]